MPLTDAEIQELKQRHRRTAECLENIDTLKSAIVRCKRDDRVRFEVCVVAGRTDNLADFHVGDSINKVINLPRETDRNLSLHMSKCLEDYLTSCLESEKKRLESI